VNKVNIFLPKKRISLRKPIFTDIKNRKGEKFFFLKRQDRAKNHIGRK
jgi:hypothetical protein